MTFDKWLETVRQDHVSVKHTKWLQERYLDWLAAEQEAAEKEAARKEDE